MASKRTARHSCNHTAPSALAKHSDDYSTWTWRMGLILAAMYLVMAFGAVVFGW